jgi:hypothetical protein
MSSEKETLEKVIGGILDIADKERKASDSYKNLFEKSDGLQGFISHLENEIVSIVLDGATVLQQKFGYKNINNDTYHFLLSLGLANNLLENKITKEEGTSCCVDKTHFILAKILRDKLNTPLPTITSRQVNNRYW